MGYIDLHVHSDASDGTLSPHQVVLRAANLGLDAIALTDHDTVDGLPEAISTAAGLPIELIPGIEMSCVYHGTMIHILGLYLDLSCRTLSLGLAHIRHVRDERNRIMLDRFCQDGFVITREDLFAGNPDTVITRSHFARVLTEKGYTSTMKQAFDRYLKYGGRYCSPREETTPETALGLLKAAHAFPVIAHPLQYHLGYQQIEDMIENLKTMGLKGMEVYHSSHTAYESGKLKDMAKRQSLLPTGGSDFHGSNKPDIEIGRGRGKLRVSHLLLDDIKKSHQSFPF